MTVFVGLNLIWPTTYRIYSRISREILDKIWLKFYQFDLYAGQHFWSSKYVFIHYLCVLRHYKCLDKVLKNVNFGQFFGLIFSIRLIRGSTYSRVYTVLLCWCWVFSNDLLFLTIFFRQEWSIIFFVEWKFVRLDKIVGNNI